MNALGQALRDRCAAAEDYELIAAAADHVEAEMHGGNRLCKALIEFDRVRGLVLLQNAHPPFRPWAIRGRSGTD